MYQNFDDKTTTRKGTLGEDIVINWLESKDWVVYTPKTNKAHWFDSLLVKDKQRVMAVEVKTKAKMNKYEGTGIDVRHYKEYLNFIKLHPEIELWIIFVDEGLERVYGNNIKKLKTEVIEKDGKKYPIIICNGKIIVFGISNMMCLPIEDIDWEEIRKLNTRNYDYEPHT